MITPELKDNVLKYLVKTYPLNELHQIDTSLLKNEFGLTWDVVKNLFEIYKNDNLVTNLTFRYTNTQLILSVNIIDFMDNGGYTSRAETKFLVQENLRLNNEKLKTEYNVLRSELENLKQTNPTLAERILACMANIATITGFIL